MIIENTCGVENKATRTFGGTKVAPNKYPWLALF
ncbi:hypothetical protein B4U80_09156 [Leptotrombidium deliense]|uniref:Uncharacterized protein n=1 Tax=Leptotrombidium deliense TaxID=299467 RepID=A0A443RZK7_9ACAR|nr:hypothetical protein B4U80_09156 [Leptotrombidium deliense]